MAKDNRTTKDRVIAIETHIEYIRCIVEKLATKRELSVHRWLIGGVITAMGFIFGKLLMGGLI